MQEAKMKNVYEVMIELENYGRKVMFNPSTLDSILLDPKDIKKIFFACKDFRRAIFEKRDFKRNFPLVEIKEQTKYTVTLNNGLLIEFCIWGNTGKFHGYDRNTTVYYFSH
jgi:hypothetical protein